MERTSVPAKTKALKCRVRGRFKWPAGSPAFLVCLATVVFLILRIRRPEPAAVFLVGANYANNLAVPHNVPGWEGLVGIRQVSEKPPPWSLFYPASLQLIGERDEALNQLDHKGQWNDLITNRASEAHHGTDVAHRGGAPRRLPARKGLTSCPMRSPARKQGLDLKDVIASMAKLPAEQNKILVLEGAEVPTAWRLGMVHNDFARRLKELEPEIEKVPNLWVLSGCDVNQRCWASEALGRTIFTHYIIEALRGAAAGPDQRLSLEELYQYVHKERARLGLECPRRAPGASAPAGISGRQGCRHRAARSRSWSTWPSSATATASSAGARIGSQEPFRYPGCLERVSPSGNQGPAADGLLAQALARVPRHARSLRGAPSCGCREPCQRFDERNGSCSWRQT